MISFRGGGRARRLPAVVPLGKIRERLPGLRWRASLRQSRCRKTAPRSGPCAGDAGSATQVHQAHNERQGASF